MFKLNPKSISINYLYGYVNLLTNEWNDGIAAKIIRDASEEPPEDQQWLIFDGPVDTIWVENLNTVFDDNKTLCLSNGQRIKIT
jgi:dynein heavy chain